MFPARAAILESPDGPFEIRDIEIEDPRPVEVLVRMAATGICATDAHVRAIPPGRPPDGRLRGRPLRLGPAPVPLPPFRRLLGGDDQLLARKVQAGSKIRTIDGPTSPNRLINRHLRRSALVRQLYHQQTKNLPVLHQPPSRLLAPSPDQVGAGVFGDALLPDGRHPADTATRNPSCIRDSSAPANMYARSAPEEVETNRSDRRRQE